MASEETERRQDRHQRALAAGLGAGAGAIVAGPVGVIAGAALGPLLEPLAALVWTELTATGQRCTGEALASACEAGIQPDELPSRINASERTQLLTGYALAAATRTTWQGKLRTLGRSLAAGLLAEDDAQIDIEQMIIAAIADIEGPQLSLLNLLVSYEPRIVCDQVQDELLDIPAYSQGLSRNGGWEVGGRVWSVRQMGEARRRLVPVLSSLLGTMQRHGLAVQTAARGWAIEQEDAPALPSGISPGESTWSPTELGELVFLRFRDAGTGEPDAWTMPPDESP